MLRENVRHENKPFLSKIVVRFSNHWMMAGLRKCGGNGKLLREIWYQNLILILKHNKNNNLIYLNDHFISKAQKLRNLRWKDSKAFIFSFETKKAPTTRFKFEYTVKKYYNLFFGFSFNFLFRRSCDDEKRNVVEMQKNTRQGRKTTNNLQTWSSLVQALFECTLNRILSVGVLICLPCVLINPINCIRSIAQKLRGNKT